MGLAEKRKASSAMAAYMKEHGIKRDTANCPMCHRPKGLSSLINHLRVCKGSRKN